MIVQSTASHTMSSPTWEPLANKPSGKRGRERRGGVGGRERERDREKENEEKMKRE